MRMNFKPYVWVLAVVVGTGIIGSTVRTYGVSGNECRRSRPRLFEKQEVPARGARRQG